VIELCQILDAQHGALFFLRRNRRSTKEKKEQK